MPRRHLDNNNGSGDGGGGYWWKVADFSALQKINSLRLGKQVLPRRIIKYTNCLSHTLPFYAI